MKKKQIVSFAVITVILVILVYLQFRSWRSFDWVKFRQYTGGVSLLHIGLGIVLIYMGYVMRAIRWAIFLRPTKPTSFRRLLAPQVIGFSALGLFGRAGEFARPYMIARKEGLTFTSQLAVWTVERFFDLGSVLVLISTFLFFVGGAKVRLLKQDLGHGLASVAANSTHKLPLLLAAVAVLVVLYFLLRKAGGKLARSLRARLAAFKDGFNTIHDFKSLLQIIAVSALMWLMIAGAYIAVLHAYGSVPVLAADGSAHLAQMRTLGLEDVLIIMACSMAGSVIQLPGGVGGSQLAVITILQSHFFNGAPTYISPELAVSCGIMLWLVTFMSVIPAGILLARFEKISFLSLGEGTTHEEATVAVQSAQ